MKRATALRYAAEIARRVHSVNGLLATPNCSREAMRIRRVWVFGSTVKGAESPNDLDVLIEADEAGRYTPWCLGRKLDHEHARRCGFDSLPSSQHTLLLWLTRGMRNVSRHLTSREAVEIDVKRLIYPRWDIDA